MKLHAVVGSNNSRKVLAVVNHLGLDVEIEYMDFFEGDLQRPGYLALNPNGKVPVLEDGAFVLWESNAINQYLADLGAETSLYPRDARTRAAINQWLCWELAHYNSSFGTLVWETVAKPNFLGQVCDDAVAASATAYLQRYAAVLDKHMNGRQFVVGDEITLADYALIHIEWFKAMVPFDWSPYPHLNGYYDRMRQAEHWAATAPPGPEAVGRRPGAA